MYKLTFFVPQSHLYEVKQVLFLAGAGKIGNYDHCCWQVLGEGQFRPLDSSKPFIGKQGSIEALAEYRVEMVCKRGVLKTAVEALLKAHPYEEPAFDVVELIDINALV